MPEPDLIQSIAPGSLPFLYESTGVETFFRDERDPSPRSRRVFSFHRPETLAAWLTQPDTLRTRLADMPVAQSRRAGRGSRALPRETNRRQARMKMRLEPLRSLAGQLAAPQAEARALDLFAGDRELAAFRGPRMVYIIKCTRCGKEFKRSKADFTLRPHKGRGGWQCPSLTGHLVRTSHE